MKGRRFLPAFLHVKRNFILMYKIQNPPMAQGFRGILSCAAFSCRLDIYIRLDYILNLSVLHFKQLYIFPYEYENVLIGRAPLILRDKSYFI